MRVARMASVPPSSRPRTPANRRVDGAIAPAPFRLVCPVSRCDGRRVSNARFVRNRRHGRAAGPRPAAAEAPRRDPAIPRRNESRLRRTAAQGGAMPDGWGCRRRGAPRGPARSVGSVRPMLSAGGWAGRKAAEGAAVQRLQAPPFPENARQGTDGHASGVEPVSSARTCRLRSVAGRGKGQFPLPRRFGVLCPGQGRGIRAQASYPTLALFIYRGVAGHRHITSCDG